MTETTLQPAREELRALAVEIFDTLRQSTAARRGVSRESFGAGENAAFEILIDVAKRFGLETGTDSAANLLISLPGQARETPYVACGSHMDSVPEGGNFDGAAGVIAGLLGLVRARMEDAEPRRPVRVIALRGEESAWYGKACVGSSALFGRLQKADLASVHRDGTGTLGEAMQRNGAAIDAIETGTPLVDPADIAGYVELHIEQGPILVADSLPTAVVTSIRGNLRHRRIRCIGEAGHSGAVPRGLRNDPVMATAALIHALDNHWRDWLEQGHDIVVTTGIVETDGRSHSVSRIAGEVAFSFEVRSEDTNTLESFYDLMRSECDRIAAERRVMFNFDRRVDAEPAIMDRRWVDKLLAHARTLSLPERTILSGAGHDAVLFASAGIPSAMIFIRNHNGSHNPNEAMDIDDFLKGADLLYRALMDPP